MARKTKAQNRSRLQAASTKRYVVFTLLLANALVIGIFAYASLLDAGDSDRYYRAVQEDEMLEWATFWAFMIAAGLFLAGALRARRAGTKVPWFHVGLSLFCFVVAMEEISWAQRVLGYRPPDYFLANNFQQELNVHNIMATSLRKLMLKAVLLGYGALLPVVALIPSVRRLFERLAIVVPHIALVPTFVLAYWVYEDYPWRFAGEWVEMTLGLSFLFTALLRPVPEIDAQSSVPRQLLPIIVPTVAVVLLGWVTAAVSHKVASGRPQIVEVAKAELAAIEADFRGGEVRSKCSLHKRLYTFAIDKRQDHLFAGAFAGLVDQGLPESRAAYLIDPWNSPYWIRHRCRDKGKREVLFIYSFGPNRRRDSNKWEILGDDVGVYVVRRL